MAREIHAETRSSQPEYRLRVAATESQIKPVTPIQGNSVA
jgi:hypothetical protein